MNERLYQARLCTGWTRWEVALLLECDVELVKRHEAGEVMTDRQLREYARIYRVSTPESLQAAGAPVESETAEPVKLGEDARFMLHSAYPDKTFRGLEKCQPWLYDTPELAQAAIDEMPADERDWWSVVAVVVIMPAIRQALDVVQRVSAYSYLFPGGETDE